MSTTTVNTGKAESEIAISQLRMGMLQALMNEKIGLTTKWTDLGWKRVIKPN